MSIRTLLALFPAAVASAAALVLAAGPVPAEAAFPGANGRIVFEANSATGWDIYSINPDGSWRKQLTWSGHDSAPAGSPDGQKIAFSSHRDGNNEIYVMNAGGYGHTNLTNHPAGDAYPAWSPDGQKIAFASTRNGYYEIYVMNADGSGQTRLTNNAVIDYEPAWSPDGQKIAFTSVRDSNRDIYVMNADGSGQTRLTNPAAGDVQPAWSPDGQMIAFSSYRDGNFEVYVMNADGSGQTRRTSSSPDADLSPAWSPDGQKIAFATAWGGNSAIYVMNADGSGWAQAVPGVGTSSALSLDWQPLWSPSLPPLPPLPPAPPVPQVVTAFPESTTIEAGTLGKGSEVSLKADDDDYFQVSSTTTGTRETSWYGSMTVPNELTSLALAYTGKSSSPCMQQLELRDFDAGSWVVLDERSVGTTEVAIIVRKTEGPLDRFVSGTRGKGELHFRVGCTSGDGDFVSSGELMQIVYGLL